MSTVASSLAWIYAATAVLVLGVLSTAFYERLLAVVLIAPLILAFRQKIPSWTEVRPKLRLVIIVGLGRDVISTLLCQSALLYTASSKVMFLTKIEPYLVLLFGILLFKTRITTLSAALLIIHLAGALMLSVGDSGFEFTVGHIGDLMLILGVLANACCYEYSSQVARHFGALRSSFITQLVALPILGLLCLGWGNSILRLSNAEFGVAIFNISLTVILFSVITVSTWFYALRELPSWLVSALRSLGPVIAAPVAWIFYDQGLTAIQVIGASMIVATSIGLIWEKRQSVRNHSASTASIVKV